jgi:hypothetical protein
VSLSGGIFKGVEFKLESLRSLAAGGINFATPNDSARPVEDGQVFPLHADGRREWLNWAPRIQLGRDKEGGTDSKDGKDSKDSAQEKPVAPAAGGTSAPAKRGKSVDKNPPWPINSGAPK